MAVAELVEEAADILAAEAAPALEVVAGDTTK